MARAPANRKVAIRSAGKKRKPERLAEGVALTSVPRAHSSTSDAPVAENDRISEIFEDMLRPEQRGSDRFLDIVTWNIKWFNASNPDRIARIARIMGEINADLFILQEIEAGAMDPVVQILNGIGASTVRPAATSASCSSTISRMCGHRPIR
jgi:hypothetical protein